MECPAQQVDRKQKRVVVEKSGVPVAAIVSTEDLDQLTGLPAAGEAQERELDAALAGARAAFADVPEEQLVRDVAMAIARVRKAWRFGASPPPST